MVSSASLLQLSLAEGERLSDTGRENNLQKIHSVYYVIWDITLVWYQTIFKDSVKDSLSTVEQQFAEEKKVMMLMMF